MNIVTFILAGLVGYFAPTPTYPSTTDHICALNNVPVGTVVQLVNYKNGKQSYCTIAGKSVSLDTKVVMSVSEAVRKDLGFTSYGYAWVYRVIGHMPTCYEKPTKTECQVPPAACVKNLTDKGDKVPKASLVVCVN